MKKILTIGILGLFIFLVLMPSISSTTYKVEKNNEIPSDPMKLNQPVYLGEIFINGDGNVENLIMQIDGEGNLEIPIPHNGAEVEFKVKYNINCQGIDD